MWQVTSIFDKSSEEIKQVALMTEGLAIRTVTQKLKCLLSLGEPCFLEKHCERCQQAPWSYTARASTTLTVLSCSTGCSPSSIHAWNYHNSPAKQERRTIIHYQKQYMVEAMETRLNVKAMEVGNGKLKIQVPTSAYVKQKLIATSQEFSGQPLVTVPV